MQWVADLPADSSLAPVSGPHAARPVGHAAFDAQGEAIRFADYKIIRRNGSVVAFEPQKIAIAMTKAFLAVNGGQGAASARVRELVEQLTANGRAGADPPASRPVAPSTSRTSRTTSNSR